LGEGYVESKQAGVSGCLSVRKEIKRAANISVASEEMLQVAWFKKPWRGKLGKKGILKVEASCA